MKILSNKFIENNKPEESALSVSGKNGDRGGLGLNTSADEKQNNEIVVNIKDPDVKKIKALCYNRHGHFGIYRTSCMSYADLNFISTQVSVAIENKGITDDDFSNDYTLWQRTTGKTLQIISKCLTTLGDLNARVPSEIKIGVDYSPKGIENGEVFIKDLVNIFSQLNPQDIIEKFKNAVSSDMYINKLVQNE